MTLKHKILFVCGIFGVLGVFFVLPYTASADTQGQMKNFFVNSDFDLETREKVSTVLQVVSENAYFY